MKSRLLFLTVLLIIICASCQPKKKTEPEKKAVTGATYTNPLRERGAEPWAVFYFPRLSFSFPVPFAVQ